MWKLATLDDLVQDAAFDLQRALKSLEAVNEFADQVVSGNGGLQTKP